MGDLDIGLMNVIYQKIRSKLYNLIIKIYNLYYTFIYRKTYGKTESRSPYRSNSLEHKSKKQEYPDKKEKVNIPSPNLAQKNSKSEMIKEPAEKAKESVPPKPDEKPKDE